MSLPKPKSTLAAKAVHLVYEFPGTLMKGWEAERVGDGLVYLIHRANGTTREVNLHVPTRTAKGDILPSVNEHGLLTIGDWSVLIGRDINHDWHARKVGGKDQESYLVFDGKMGQVGRFKVGDDFEGRPVSKVHGHLIQIGDNVVPIKPKKYEITLLVMNNERDGGYVSYINLIEKGNNMNRKDGAQGIFYRPKKPGEPAQFVETHNGKKVVTAMFWLEGNGKKVTYQFREANTAVMTDMVSQKMEEARIIAIDAGLDPEDFDEYVDYAKQFEDLNNMWRKDGMSLQVGPELFKSRSLDNDGPSF